MDSPENVCMTSSTIRDKSPKTDDSQNDGSTTSPNKPTPGGGRPRPPRPSKPPIAQKPALRPKPSPPKSSHKETAKPGPPPLPLTPPRGVVRPKPADHTSKTLSKSSPNIHKSSSDEPSIQSKIKSNEDLTKRDVINKSNGSICSEDLKEADISNITSESFAHSTIEKDSSFISDITTDEDSSFFLHPDHLYSEIPETPPSKQNVKNVQSRESKVNKSSKYDDTIIDRVPSKPVPKLRRSIGRMPDSESDVSSESSSFMELMTGRNEVPDTSDRSPSKTSLSDTVLSSPISLTTASSSDIDTSISSVNTEISVNVSKQELSDSSNAQLESSANLHPDASTSGPMNAQKSPTDTCDMLKEIEDLLNKKLAEVSLADELESKNESEYCVPPLEDEDEQPVPEVSKQCVPRRHSLGPSVLEKNDKTQMRYSLSSTPVRPPRPKRAASKLLKQFSTELDPGSSGSTESLDSNVVEVVVKKKCPPKPKRTTLPRVGRTQSDVTGMRSFVEEKSSKPPPVPQRPVFQSPDLPPPLPPRNKPQNMKGLGSRSNSKENVGTTKINGQAELIKTALGSQQQSPGTAYDPKARPLRKAPPPPENPPSVSRLKSPPIRMKRSQSFENKGESDTTNNQRKLSSQESQGFLMTDNDPLAGQEKDDVSLDLDSSVPLQNVSRVSSDHDYHEIPDGLVRDEPPSPVDKTESNITGNKETSPPPELPPRTYREPLKGKIDHQSDNSGESSGSVNSVKDTVNSCDNKNKEGKRSGSSTPKSGSRPMSTASQQSSYSESGSLENQQNGLSSPSGSDNEDEESLDAKRRRKAFLTAKEIVTSEMVFVDVLKLLNVDFRVAMSKATEASDKPVVPTEILNKILNYLPQLQNFNEVLLKDLNDRIQKWDEHPMVADIFVKKGPFLKLYSSYIQNFKNATALFDESCKKYPFFNTAVRHFESSPRCASLALKHHMLKPIQRIPQYKLLLQDYLKHLTKESADYQNTIQALTIVSKVADHADQSTRQGDDVHKLMEIQNALIGQFEVIQPGRELIKCGELMKLSRKELQPRMFFLFNDVLLYTVSVASGYRLNQILPVNGMKVSKPTAEDFKNEFNILSVQRSFTVAASTPEERDDWLKTLNQTIEAAAQRKNTFQLVKLQDTPQTSLLDKDFKVGHKAPIMVPDARVTMCMLCLGEFTITWRRHHCRACGRVVCGNCSEKKAPLRYLSYKSARVCSECYDKIEKEVQEGDVDIKNIDNTDGTILTLANLKDRFEKIRKSARSNKGAIKRPAHLKEVKANDEGSDMSGYIKSYKNKKWKKMWYVLKNNVLYTYKASEDMAAVESLPLLGYEVTTASIPFEGVEPELVFHLIHPNTPPHIFKTDSASATMKWVSVMRKASVP